MDIKINSPELQEYFYDVPHRLYCRLKGSRQFAQTGRYIDFCVNDLIHFTDMDTGEIMSVGITNIALNFCAKDNIDITPRVNFFNHSAEHPVKRGEGQYLVVYDFIILATLPSENQDTTTNNEDENKNKWLLVCNSTKTNCVVTAHCPHCYCADCISEAPEFLMPLSEPVLVRLQSINRKDNTELALQLAAKILQEKGYRHCPQCGAKLS